VPSTVRTGAPLRRKRAYERPPRLAASRPEGGGRKAVERLKGIAEMSVTQRLAPSTARSRRLETATYTALDGHSATRLTIANPSACTPLTSCADILGAPKGSTRPSSDPRSDAMPRGIRCADTNRRSGIAVSDIWTSAPYLRAPRRSTVGKGWAKTQMAASQDDAVRAGRY
jgi:hypothetical protein